MTWFPAMAVMRVTRADKWHGRSRPVLRLWRCVLRKVGNNWDVQLLAVLNGADDSQLRCNPTFSRTLKLMIYLLMVVQQPIPVPSGPKQIAEHDDSSLSW